MISDATDEAVHEGADDLAPLIASFVAMLPVEEAAASSLGAPFDIETIVATGPRSAQLDEVQIDLGEGPGWEAFRSGRPSTMSLESSDDRSAWPFLASSPAAAGVCSIVSVPLVFGPLGIGAVSLYSSAAIELDTEQFHLAESLAVLLGRAIVARALQEAENGAVVRDPFLSRREVHQATGMVISQTRSTPGDSLLAIRAYAYSNGMSVRDVAAEIVARRLDFSSGRPGDSGTEDRK